MTVENLVVDWNLSLHNAKQGGALIAVGIREAYEYVGSRRTDRITGYYVEVVDTLNRFEKTEVKVMTAEKPFEITDSGEYLSVFFVGLKGKLFMDYNTKSVRFSVTADSVQILNDED